MVKLKEGNLDMEANKNRMDRIAARASEATRRHVRKSIDIADRISMILEAQGKTQKDLAKALGKSESEISKWLGGQHNFTIRTLTAVEDALGENVFTVPGGKRHQLYYSDSYTPGELGKQISEGHLKLIEKLSQLNWERDGKKPELKPLADVPDDEYTHNEEMQQLILGAA